MLSLKGPTFKKTKKNTISKKVAQWGKTLEKGGFIITNFNYNRSWNIPVRGIFSMFYFNDRLSLI